MHRLPQSKALVLDEPAWSPLFKGMLSKLDWSCEVVSSTEEAQALLQFSDYDVLIVDYFFLQASGLHFVRSLRQRDILLPAIVTSFESRVLRLTPREILGIRSVLLKPFTLADLENALHGAVV